MTFMIPETFTSTSPILLAASQRLVAVFPDNTDIVIAEVSADAKPLAKYYESIDLNDNSDALCLTGEQWDALGKLPAGYSLMPVLEHPILQDVFYVAALQDTGDAEKYLFDKYPQGYSMLGVLDSGDPGNAIGYLMHCHYKLCMGPEDEDADWDELDDELLD